MSFKLFFMTIFTITSNTYTDGGANLGFDAKSDYGSPTKVELDLLKEYLTPKALNLLQDILKKQLEQHET